MGKKKAAGKKKGTAKKIQPLRLYLIKKSVKKYEEALRDDVPLESYSLKPTLLFTGKLFLRKSITQPVDWRDFLQTGIKQSLPPMETTPNAAVLFLDIGKRMMALVFGTGRYLLRDTCYEADFGIVSTLNTIDPKTLRSIDVHSFEEMVMHKRVQLSRRARLDAFEVDVQRERFRSLTGMAKDNELAGRVCGTEGGFGVSARLDFAALAEKCKEYLKAYQSDTYRKDFPSYDDFNVVADGQLLDELDATLVDRLRNQKTKDIHLAPPEPIDPEEFSGFSLTAKGDLRDELSIEEYLSTRNDPTALDLDALKRHQVFVRLEGVDIPVAKWSVYRCIICEIRKGKKLFVLWNGRWVQLSTQFAQRVRDYVSKIPESKVDLPSPTKIIREPDYIKHVAQTKPEFALVDRKQAWCETAGSGIEICDLFLPAGHAFIHLKRKAEGSSALSHLFLQGRNAATAFVKDEQFRKRTKEQLAKIDKKAGGKIPLGSVPSGKFEVVFGVMGTFKGGVAESLPFFSQLTLMLVAREIKAVGMKVALKKIETPES